MSQETKERLLQAQRCGLYNSLAPEQALKLYHESKGYLNVAFQNVMVDENSARELYDITELQFYLALITNHDTEAKLMLDRLQDKFGDYKTSQRIAVLKSIYIEATSDSDGHKKAGEFLEHMPLFGKKIDVIRRRTYLTSKLQPSDYIHDLNSYLEVKPSDAQAWYELGETYFLLGNYQKAVFSFQQILLYSPFAYNVAYKLGAVYQSYAYKILYDFSNTNNSAKRDSFNYNSATIEKFYINYDLALKNYLKSVELCESYYKGWAGVYCMTKPLEFKNKNLLAKFEPRIEQFEQLNTLSKRKLQDIVKNKWTSQENIDLINKLLSS